MAKKDKPKPKKDAPFVVGEQISSTYRPTFFNIKKPTTALAVTETDQCMSGFLITVDTDHGPKNLDSGLFSKVNK